MYRQQQSFQELCSKISFNRYDDIKRFWIGCHEIIYGYIDREATMILLPEEYIFQLKDFSKSTIVISLTEKIDRTLANAIAYYITKQFRTITEENADVILEYTLSTINGYSFSTSYMPHICEINIPFIAKENIIYNLFGENSFIYIPQKYCYKFIGNYNVQNRSVAYMQQIYGKDKGYVMANLMQIYEEKSFDESYETILNTFIRVTDKYCDPLVWQSIDV